MEIGADQHLLGIVHRRQRRSCAQPGNRQGKRHNKQGAQTVLQGQLDAEPEPLAQQGKKSAHGWQGETERGESRFSFLTRSADSAENGAAGLPMVQPTPGKTKNGHPPD
jgi:hypothetical protein